jgi:hypothetical protein
MNAQAWSEEAVRLLHRGALAEAETYVARVPPAGVPGGYRDLLLLEVYTAQGKRGQAAAVFERLLWNPWCHATPEFLPKLRRYTEYHTKVWAPRIHALRPPAVFPSWETHVDGSVCVLPSGGLGVLTRSLNASFDGKELSVGTADQWKRVINRLHWFELDSTLRTVTYTEVRDTARYPRASDLFVGYEDARVFLWNQALWFTATTYQLYNSGKAHIVLVAFDQGAATRVVPLQCPDMNDPQRRWQPWVHQGQVHLIYKTQPWTVLRLESADTGATTVVAQQAYMAWPEARVDAMCSPVPYGDGYLTIMSYHDSEERSLSRFVRLGPDLLPTQMSSTWVLWKPEHETLSGLAVLGEYLYLVYGYAQKECRLTRWSTRLLETEVRWYPCLRRKA